MNKGVLNLFNNNVAHVCINIILKIKSLMTSTSSVNLARNPQRHKEVPKIYKSVGIGIENLVHLVQEQFI